jgi:hypothetical protein
MESSTSPEPDRPLSVLRLQFDVVDDRPDWPVVTIKVDDRDPFAPVADGWRGFGPEKILDPASPLLPDAAGQRVALYVCECGEAGCGVIAPIIVASADGRRVSWVDFRDYVGVFHGPTVESSELSDGEPWGLPDLHFDRAQYEAEVRRAAADRSWETPARVTARLVAARIRDLGLTLPPDHDFKWAAPAWKTDGLVLSFERPLLAGETGTGQVLLRLASHAGDPQEAAADIVEQLVGVAPDDRARVFGYDPHGLSEAQANRWRTESGSSS